ncbi:hypothetical protein CBR_g34914 [Chara braunii]|uniref:Uncharacterized protein n=1 Tax=Chara braunii TaxID=69332 RepID=A0A388LJP3_CHABU|nr:hypothetical protein CBR_g34914 [Chara braunii]|eukprot:GBG82538.1 hypothetical protein CBR_g34914 [Chara braunii]
MAALGVKPSSPASKAVSFSAVLALVILFTAKFCAAAATNTVDGALAQHGDELLPHQQHTAPIVTTAKSGNARRLVSRSRQANEDSGDGNGSGSSHEEHLPGDGTNSDHMDNNGEQTPFYVSSAKSAISCARLFSLVMCHLVAVLLLIVLPGVRETVL